MAILNGRSIATSLTPRRDIADLDQEWNQWMNSQKDITRDYGTELESLKIHFGKNFSGFDQAQRELAMRPKYKEYCKKVDEFREAREQLLRLAKATEVGEDTANSYLWMTRDSIGVKQGKFGMTPGSSKHVPTKHVHFQEGVGALPVPKSRRGRVVRFG